MKILIFLVCFLQALAFIPNFSRQYKSVKLVSSTRRDDIAHEIHDLTGISPKKTHASNPWKKVLETPHPDRVHEMKQHLETLRLNNKQLDKHVHELEKSMQALFCMAEVLAANEKYLLEKIDTLEKERNSLWKTVRRSFVLIGKRILWPFRATMRLFGLKKKAG